MYYLIWDNTGRLNTFSFVLGWGVLSTSGALLDRKVRLEDLIWH